MLANANAERKQKETKIALVSMFILCMTHAQNIAGFVLPYLGISQNEGKNQPVLDYSN